MRTMHAFPAQGAILVVCIIAMASLWGCEYNQIIVEAPPELVPYEEEEPYYIDLEPTLASIQDSLFTGTCQNSRCHDGFWNAGKLDLTKGVSHSDLVNVPSQLDSTMLRVYPGKPDSSYLVWKIEGHPRMRGRLMPLWSRNQRLHPDVVQAVRDWILDGAKE